MIEMNQLLHLHRRVLAVSGGGAGIRDNVSLESATVRPFLTFDGDRLYPGLLEKSAALMESLIADHPFVDGNKRTGYIAGIALLDANGMTITASEDECFDLVMSVASGKSGYDEILNWLKKNTQKR